MNAGDEDGSGAGRGGGPQGQRLDKWLWFARVTKTRTLAAALIVEGKVRVNGERVDKVSTTVRIGDALTIVLRQQVRVLVVMGFAARRGGAALAAAVYEDRTPKPTPAEVALAKVSADALREPGSGRPTKRQRRELDRFKSRST